MGKPKTIDNILTPDEIKRLKESAISLRERLIVYTLLNTGMRNGEFVHLSKDWIDFKRRQIRIPQEIKCDCRRCSKPYINKKSGKITRPAGVWRPKTPQAMRIIPLNPITFKLLKDFFEAFDSIKAMIPSTGSVNYHIKRIAGRAKIPHPVFAQSLRGTFASTLAMQQFTSPEIKEIMGWKSIVPAEKYIKLFSPHIKKVFDQKWKGI